jgi:stage II sporulation protein AA (anti-sigma F factor antagonist)
MKITGSCQEGVLTLRFQGELDHHVSQEVMAALSERIDAFLPRKCVLDLRGLSFMDSSGIALLLRAEKKMRQLEGSLLVTGVQEQPGRVLRAAGADQRLGITE